MGDKNKKTIYLTFDCGYENGNTEPILDALKKHNAKATIFDLLLPRILADVPVTKKDLAKMGAGGLCLGCDICTYPNCGFGKGV